MNDFIQQKMLPVIMKFVNSKPLVAIKDGVLYSIPAIIIGSIFLLLESFPFQPVADFFASAGLVPAMDQVVACSFNMMSLIAVIGITYTYVKNDGHTPLPAVFIAMTCFFVLQPGMLATDADATPVIIKDWCSGKGMVAAIIVGLAVGSIYSWFLTNKITIKMPDQVPDGVSSTFSSLIPGVVLVFVAFAINAIFDIAFGTTFLEWIYTVLQAPLQGLTDTLPGMLIAVFLISFLWWFGIHGAAVVDGVLYGLWAANAASNQGLVDKGVELTRAAGAHIVTAQFYDQFIVVTGSCITIGAVIFMCFFAKSERYRAIGKVGIIPSIFNVNEPILFGTPFVMNPFLFIPMVILPLVITTIQYLAISWGICPMYTGVMVPWTTPIIISGFLVGGWRTALLQAITLALSCAAYFPFMKKLDQIALEEESQNVAQDA